MGSADRMPWFQLYVADWLMSERIDDLDPLAENAYFRCLLRQWWSDNGKVSTEQRLLKASRLTPDQWEEHKEAVLQFFEQDEEGYYNQRLYDQWCEKKALREKNAESGRKGGQAKAKAPAKQPIKRTPKQTETKAETETKQKQNNKNPDFPLADFEAAIRSWNGMCEKHPVFKTVDPDPEKNGQGVKANFQKRYDDTYCRENMILAIEKIPLCDCAIWLEENWVANFVWLFQLCRDDRGMTNIEKIMEKWQERNPNNDNPQIPF